MGLKITRYEGEKVVINEGEVVVTVVRHKKGHLILDFDFEQPTSVWRGEIYDKILAEKLLF
jgi:sRNA-binding carbon storage regulator CsrA